MEVRKPRAPTTQRIKLENDVNQVTKTVDGTPNFTTVREVLGQGSVLFLANVHFQNWVDRAGTLFVAYLLMSTAIIGRKALTVSVSHIPQVKSILKCKNMLFTGSSRVQKLCKRGSPKLLDSMK